MLRLQAVRKVYERGRTTLEALAGVDLHVPRGQFAAVVGPSGSGKSTLLHLAGALDVPTSGEVLIGDKPLSKMKDDELTELRRTQIGFVFQFFNLLPTLTARENTMLPALLAGASQARAREEADALLADVGLTDRADHRPDELSGGQMQRVALARGLITRPALLLADEPTGNLDTHTGEEILGLLRELSRKRGTTVIIVTHDRKAAERADRIVALRDGRVESDSVTSFDSAPRSAGGPRSG